MNYVRFLGLLAEKAGGWESFTEPVNLTPKQFARILNDPDVLADVTDPAAPTEGRLRIIHEGIKNGRSLKYVQYELTTARQPRLYSRNCKEAAVVYLLSLNEDLTNALMIPREKAHKLRLKWLRELQSHAIKAMQDHLGEDDLTNQSALLQNQALATLRGAIHQGQCTYSDLTAYVNAAFQKDGSTFVVTNSITGSMTQATEAVRGKLTGLHSEEEIQTCLFDYWDAFLKKAAPAFVQSRLTATNYMLRSLVRALDPFYTALGAVTAQLTPRAGQLDWAFSHLLHLLTDETVLLNQDENLEYVGILTALFSQNRTVTAERALLNELTKKKYRQELSAGLRPFFYFYEQNAPKEADRHKRAELAKQHWAEQTLYLSGIARLLLEMLDPGYTDEKDRKPHQKKMEELFARSGSYLARVLRGEADMDRDIFLLFLLLSEDFCARQIPQREQLAWRLQAESQDPRNLLTRCGLNPLEKFTPFDAALQAALLTDLPATQRKDCFLKALQVCEETRRDPEAGREALAQDASEYSGQLAAINSVFRRLRVGTHASLAGLHD